MAHAPRPTPRWLIFAPAVAYDDDQIDALVTLSLLMAMTTFGASLLSQNVDFVGRSFGASDRALGGALAISRAGVAIALVGTALADRHGRRRLLLLAFGGLCAANAAGGLAPSLGAFTVAQVLMRGCALTAMTLAPMAALEEAPDGARAYAMAFTGVAGVAGYGLGVLLLPLSDLQPGAWRLSFALSAATLAALPFFARRLRETRRYEHLATAGWRRGRLGQVVGSASGERFALLMAFGFVAATFTAPLSQFTNRYLAQERDFSGLDVTLFRIATQAVPGLLGLIIGGRLAEIRGRRPVAVAAVFGGTLAEMIFLLSDGPVLWLASALGVLVGGMAAPAVGAWSGELFPTEIRGTANALQIVAGVSGAALGLVLAGHLSGYFGLGPSVALLGLPTLAGALILVPRLPESSARRLEDLSPSETNTLTPAPRRAVERFQA